MLIKTIILAVLLIFSTQAAKFSMLTGELSPSLKIEDTIEEKHFHEVKLVEMKSHALKCVESQNNQTIVSRCGDYFNLSGISLTDPNDKQGNWFKSNCWIFNAKTGQMTQAFMIDWSNPASIENFDYGWACKDMNRWGIYYPGNCSWSFGLIKPMSEPVPQPQQTANTTNCVEEEEKEEEAVIVNDNNSSNPNNISSTIEHVEVEIEVEPISELSHIEAINEEQQEEEQQHEVEQVVEIEENQPIELIENPPIEEIEKPYVPEIEISESNNEVPYISVTEVSEIVVEESSTPELILPEFHHETLTIPKVEIPMVEVEIPTTHEVEVPVIPHTSITIIEIFENFENKITIPSITIIETNETIGAVEVMESSPMCPDYIENIPVEIYELEVEEETIIPEESHETHIEVEEVTIETHEAEIEEQIITPYEVLLGEEVSTSHEVVEIKPEETVREEQTENEIEFITIIRYVCIDELNNTIPITSPVNTPIIENYVPEETFVENPVVIIEEESAPEVYETEVIEEHYQEIENEEIAPILILPSETENEVIQIAEIPAYHEVEQYQVEIVEVPVFHEVEVVVEMEEEEAKQEVQIIQIPVYHEETIPEVSVVIEKTEEVSIETPIIIIEECTPPLFEVPIYHEETIIPVFEAKEEEVFIETPPIVMEEYSTPSNNIAQVTNNYEMPVFEIIETLEEVYVQEEEHIEIPTIITQGCSTEPDNVIEMPIYHSEKISPVEIVETSEEFIETPSISIEECVVPTEETVEIATMPPLPIMPSNPIQHCGSDEPLGSLSIQQGTFSYYLATDDQGDIIYEFMSNQESSADNEAGDVIVSYNYKNIGGVPQANFQTLVYKDLPDGELEISGCTGWWKNEEVDITNIGDENTQWFMKNCHILDPSTQQRYAAHTINFETLRGKTMKYGTWICDTPEGEFQFNFDTCKWHKLNQHDLLGNKLLIIQQKYGTKPPTMLIDKTPSLLKSFGLNQQK